MQNFESLYDQLKKLLVQKGYFSITRKKGKKPIYYYRTGTIIEPLSQNDFGTICREILKEYLNQKNFNTIIEANADSITTTTSITIRRQDLETASRRGFTLNHEVKELIQVCDLSPEFKRDESSFIPKHGQLPVQNGIINLSNLNITFIPNDGKSVFFSRLNASFSENNHDFPDLFLNVIKNGIYNHDYEDDINKERISSFLDCLAYTLIPGNPLCKLFWIYGATQAGKSKLMEIMKIIFGNYAVEVEATSFTKHSRTNPELRPDLYYLGEKFLIVCSETEKSKKLDSRLIKTMTGGDNISVRSLYNDTFHNNKISGKIFFISNFFPEFANPDDNAISERVVVIDWYNTVPSEKRIHNLVEQLTTDEMRSRIFTALVYRANRLLQNDKVTLNTHTSFRYIPPPQYADKRIKQQKVLEDFYDNCIHVFSQSDRPFIPPFNFPLISGTDIYKAYYVYCHEKGYADDSLLNERNFLMKFGDYMDKLKKAYLHVDKVRHSNGYFYRGFKIINVQITWRPKMPNGFGSEY